MVEDSTALPHVIVNVRFHADEAAEVRLAAETLRRRTNHRVTVSDIVRAGALRYAREVVAPELAGEQKKAA